MPEFAEAAFKSKVASGALAVSEAPDTSKRRLTRRTLKVQTRVTKQDAGEEERLRGAAPEFGGVQACVGAQAADRMDAKFGAGGPFSDLACFLLLLVQLGHGCSACAASASI